MSDESSLHLGFSASVAESPGGGTSVTVFGELDQAAAPTLREALERAIGAAGNVELDMRACNFVDSIGIATLVFAARELHESERVLRIRGAQERVREIFELAGLLSHQWIELDPDGDAP